MAVYKIYFSKSAVKDLDGIPKKDLKKITERIALLAREPRGFGCEKLAAEEKFRVRQGNYRIVYSIRDDELVIWVVKVGHRKDVYRH